MNLERIKIAEAENKPSEVITAESNDKIVKFEKIKHFSIYASSYCNSHGTTRKQYCLSFYPERTKDFMQALVGRYQSAEHAIVGGLNDGYRSNYDAPYYATEVKGLTLCMKPSYVCDNWNEAVDILSDIAEALGCTEKQYLPMEEIAKLIERDRREVIRKKNEALEKDRERAKQGFKNQFKSLRDSMK